MRTKMQEFDFIFMVGLKEIGQQKNFLQSNHKYKVKFLLLKFMERGHQKNICHREMRETELSNSYKFLNS